MGGEPEGKGIRGGAAQAHAQQRIGAGKAGYKEIRDHVFFQDFSLDELLGRTYEPPRKPPAETYAEKENDTRYLGKLVQEEEDLRGDNANPDNWTDPDPGWDKDF